MSTIFISSNYTDMAQKLYQKGKFYMLPIKEIRNEGSDSFFIVNANDREYAIRLFGFQRTDQAVLEMTELPCMVKDVHGESIVFVQNFARMFAEKYISGKIYPFVVREETNSPQPDTRYYDVRDAQGIPFRLRCNRETLLVPGQRISCLVTRPSRDRMLLTLEKEQSKAAVKSITPDELFSHVGLEGAVARFILRGFAREDRLAEARACYRQGQAEWVVKAVTAIPGVETWHNLTNGNRGRLIDALYRIGLYLLEDSDYLLQFSESDRENYQQWIADRVSVAETYRKCLALIKEGRCGEETDAILRKIKSSGYIYHPHRRMQLLIAMFSMQPDLLEEKIDSILDLVQACAKDWKQPSFYDAFSSFLRFYIMSNREKANRIAIIGNSQSRSLLGRMVRSISFLLLMTDGKEPNAQLYRSMLYHYLSFVRASSPLERDSTHRGLAETLVERALNALLLSQERMLDFNWNRDFGNTEILAYQMANSKTESTTFLTRSYEAQNVRFTVSADGITISRTMAAEKERNILPQGFPGWHDLQIFLDSPAKYSIGAQCKNLRRWKTYWNDVEQGLFEERTNVKKKKLKKIAPEVGTDVIVRVLWKDESRPGRYYCRIEDMLYEGEGWIDTYLRGGSTGMFHYDPKFDIDSFFEDGRPLLFKVRVNALGSPNDERRTYTFDCMSYLDEMIRQQAEYGEESDCIIFHIDERNHVFCAVSEYGYGIFLPVTEDNANCQVGDSVKVRLTDGTRPNSMQGIIIGVADNLVDVRKAATEVFRDYAEEEPYEETAEELEEEAMAVSEDLFDISYMREIINIVDHKAVLETDNIKAFAFLSIGHILSRMTGDQAMMDYLEQRQRLLCVLDDYGANGRVDDEELQVLGNNNSDMAEKYPLLKQRLNEVKIVNCFGMAERNAFLWEMCTTYEHDHILARLSRLMLSYNMAEGFGLQEHQQVIVAKIKSLLNINVELPRIYSFGEEDQQTEFKTSIVFPPNNSMREDIKQQTFNIMKVICGMVNAYGGTIYLGVNDTGTAKGLVEDLHYFEESTDKYDLYIRNSIRTALGDHVNASIIVEHPDAGQHYIYAIKVTPSKTPVMLALDNKFYLREGTSTYPIEQDQLAEIMAERNFALYKTEAKDMEAVEIPEPEPEKKPEEAPKMKVLSMQGDTIATSSLRTNITENWVDGYGVDTACYVRVQKQGDWCVLDDIEWEDGILTLAIHDDEADGYLVVVYDDGKVNKVPMSQIIDKTRGNTYKMYAHKRPLFITPARRDAALLTAYEDDKGRQFLRLDDLSKMEDGKMLAAGNMLTDVEFSRLFYCEIVSQEFHDDLHRMHNLKRNSLGQQALTSYGTKEQTVLQRIGIEL